MLGERGLWFKMSFYEGSARVPLMISAPDMTPGLVTEPVSNIDVCPTLCDLAGVDGEVAPWTEGQSLVPWARAPARPPVAMEYAAEASYAPLIACGRASGNSPAARSTPINFSIWRPIRRS